MLSISLTDPSPLAQAAVYMVGILLGHAFLTPPEELQRAWNTVRSIWTGRKY
ncbi:MAG TPA: hypothetical protein VIG08_14275 [Gemmatimonadales bacterium]|jgi:hypothetical protein